MVRISDLSYVHLFGVEAIENLNKINYLFEKDSENLVKIRVIEYLLLNGQKSIMRKLKT